MRFWMHFNSMSKVKLKEDITHFLHLAAEKEVYLICPSSFGKKQ